MSMNLYIEATRKAFAFNGKGKKVTFTDRRSFDCWQTPTSLTYDVLGKATEDEKIQAYIRWADSVSEPYTENIYDYNAQVNEDFEYPIIGSKVVNPAQEHANELRQFIAMCREEGFDINFYTL